MKVQWFDHFVFKWLVKSLEDAKTPDEICNFYIRGFVFNENVKYLERIMAEYKLPNDLLKLHKRITVLADMPYQEVQIESQSQ